MNNSIKKGVGRSAKSIAQQVAKQAVREPLEVAKTAGRQVAGVEVQGTQVLSQPRPETQATAQPTVENEQKIKERGKRTLEALEKEMEDIRRQRKVKEQEELKAEQVRSVQEEKKQKPESLSEVSSKPSRKFVAGMKGKLSRLKRKTELRLPPTG